MSKHTPTFIEQCISGDVLTDEIDDFIDSWHSGPDSQPLHKYLGMTESEYALWVSDPALLPFIVTAHKDHVEVGELLHAFPLAARTGKHSNTIAVTNWLKKSGRL